MSAMVLALLLYLLLSQFKREPRPYGCMGCRTLCRFDGTTFVHVDTGRARGVDQPLEHVDPLDDSSDPLTHLATPVGFDG